MIIYSDLNTDAYYEKARTFLADEFLDGRIEEITKDDIEDCVRQDLEDDWDNLIRGVLVGNIEKDKFVAIGTIGRWDRTYIGWTPLRDWRDFINLLDDCDYIEVEDRDGQVILTGIHHDGTNQYELMRFTKEGFDFYMEHDELSDKEMIDTLIERGYVVKPNITWEY